MTKDRFESARHFAAVFSGEHVAGTEFVIGALFVSWGVGARDLILGLIIGNLLAVLSWTFVCGPIAVETRLTLYWYLRRIAGPVVTSIYNVLNAILFCILSGTMITVSASAVRIPLGIPPQTHWYPEDYRFVLVVLCVGVVVVTVAILGFRRLAQFAAICVPWIFVMFFAGAAAILPGLVRETPEVSSLSSMEDFWQLAALKIWITDPESHFGMVHVAAFAWICNLAFHVGLSDMAVLRFARSYGYGAFSACGMYLGHFLAWICAGIMGGGVAALLKTPIADLDPGAVAYQCLGFAGIICVILSGWATSNPTLYRAGLALQTITPGWPRWLVTLLAGAFTTIVACFPFIFGYLLEFVALFGILLVPVGAVVFVEHWLFPRLGLTQFRTTKAGQLVNWPALVTWIVAVVAALSLALTDTLSLFMVAIPVWFLAAVLYLLLAWRGDASSAPDSAAVADDSGRPPIPAATNQEAEGSPVSTTPVRPMSVEKQHGRVGLAAIGTVAAVSLATCFAASLWVFAGGVEGYEARSGTFRAVLAVASIIHLAAAAAWVLETEKGEAAK